MTLCWEKIGKKVSADGTTITYAAKDTNITIESRKTHIPHANGRGGTWDHTTYFVCVNGVSVVERFTLKDAKEYVENTDFVSCYLKEKREQL